MAVVGGVRFALILNKLWRIVDRINMNLEQLKQELISNNIPYSWYCLTSGLPDEKLCIDQEPDGRWVTYYSERGQRSGLKIFDTEKEACKSLFEELILAFEKGRR